VDPLSSSLSYCMRINGLSGPGFLVMIPRMKKIAPMVRVSCGSHRCSQSLPAWPTCKTPFAERPRGSTQEPQALSRRRLCALRNYRPIFQQCHNALNPTRLAIRRMSVDAENLLLMVDPSTLETSLEHERCWMCADTDDETQKETRLIGAVQMFSQPAANDATTQSAAFNAGLSHSIKDGSFITGDLCPSCKPLDRDLLVVVKTIGRMPVALAISGPWPTSHGADLQWLCEQARSSSLEITWSTIPTITPMSRAARLHAGL
jgi:hypothetical protein